MGRRPSPEPVGAVVTGRYARENIQRPGTYAYELTALRELLDRPKMSAPDTARDLAQLEQLVAQYPDHARRFVAELAPPTAAPP